MRKRWMVVAGLAMVLSVSAAPAVSAEPSPHASCNGLFSFMDAQGQLRDDVSHIFKELSAEFDSTGLVPQGDTASLRLVDMGEEGRSGSMLRIRTLAMVGVFALTAVIAASVPVAAGPIVDPDTLRRSRRRARCAARTAPP